jgi:hypothetical protein
VRAALERSEHRRRKGRNDHGVHAFLRAKRLRRAVLLGPTPPLMRYTEQDTAELLQATLLSTRGAACTRREPLTLYSDCTIGTSFILACSCSSTSADVG